jgi:hypothetical protein
MTPVTSCYHHSIWRRYSPTLVGLVFAHFWGIMAEERWRGERRSPPAGWT